MKECSCEWCNRNEKNWGGEFNRYKGKWYCHEHYQQLHTKGELRNELIYNVGLNDMDYGWAKTNKRIYRLWVGILGRACDNETKEKYPTYKDCYICERWKILSNFVEDIKLLENYDKWLENKERYELDKDIKSGGKNKCYCPEQCMFVTKTENSKQARKTTDYSYMKNENHWMYGKHHTEESKKKISESKNGKPIGCLIDRYKNKTLIDTKYWFEYVEMGFDGGAISACCKSKRKSHKGFIFKYHDLNGTKN